MAYYDELDEVPNTGGDVWIYRIKNSKKGVYYVRIKRGNATGYFTKSLKTNSKIEAFIRANRYWVQLREAEEQDLILSPRSTFSKLFPYWIEEKKRNSSERVWKHTDRQFKKYFLPYFGSYNVGNVTQTAYIKYVNSWRLIPEKSGQRKKPTLSTLNSEQSNLVAFLKWCYAKGHMRTPPSIRKIEKNKLWVSDDSRLDHSNKQRRDLVSPEVYATFREYLRYQSNVRPRDTKEPYSYLIARRRLHFYFLSIYNFVCRAGDELLLTRFKDYQLIPSEIKAGAYYMRLKTHYGKKASRHRYQNSKYLTYYSDYKYPAYFSTWRKFLKEQGFGTGPDDLVFPVKKRVGNSRYHYAFESNDEWEGDTRPLTSQAAGRQIRYLRPKLKEYLRERGNLTPRMEREIDVFAAYSVRHLAIRQLLLASNYTVDQVAERAQTGVSMITDFYYRYGLEPEGRIISRHPEPAPENTATLPDGVLEELAEDMVVIKGKGKGRNYD